MSRCLRTIAKVGSDDGRRRGRSGRARYHLGAVLAGILLLVPPSAPSAASSEAVGASPDPARSFGSPGDDGAPRVRKDVKDLSAIDRQQYVAAVLKLKATPSPYDKRYSYYDQFVAWHQTLNRCDPDDPLADHGMTGHAGPMFLPWHRQLVLLFEDALREVSRRPITVPYWDWSDPASTVAVYRDDFMGGDGSAEEDYAVTTGPFRKGNWQLVVQPVGLEWRSSGSSHLTRNLGSFAGIRLPTRGVVDRLFARRLYDLAPFDDRSDSSRSFRNAMEGWPQRLPTGEQVCPPDGRLAAVPVLAGHEMHNAVHLWAGGNVTQPAQGVRLGTVAVVETSPNDPVFWLIHANVDRLWAQWQDRYGTYTYQPTAGVPGNNIGDPMAPFDAYGMHVTPRDVSDIFELGYRYDGEARARSRLPSPALTSVASLTSSVTASSRWGQLSCLLDLSEG